MILASLITLIPLSASNGQENNTREVIYCNKFFYRIFLEAKNPFEKLARFSARTEPTILSCLYSSGHDKKRFCHDFVGVLNDFFKLPLQFSHEIKTC